jgi:hypothetical protein
MQPTNQLQVLHESLPLADQETRQKRLPTTV